MFMGEYDSEWWRGYRGCKSPARIEDGAFELVGFGGTLMPEPGETRGLALMLGMPGESPDAAAAALRENLDVLIDACGPEQVYIRGATLQETGDSRTPYACHVRVVVAPQRTVN